MIKVNTAPKGRKVKWLILLTFCSLFTFGCQAQDQEELENLSVREFVDCDECPPMVVIPGGVFQMGAKEDYKHANARQLPQQEIKIDYHIAVGKFEITRGHYYQCYLEGDCEWPVSNRSYEKIRGIKKPVPNYADSEFAMNRINWSMAQKYIQWISKKTNREYRLLSESEWEYTVRAGTTEEFWWGSGFNSDKANTREYSLRGQADKVNKLPPNSFGLYGMLGNVNEWVQDCKYSSLAGMPTNGLPRIEGNVDCTRRVIRGGGYKYNSSAATSSAKLFGDTEKEDQSEDVGFRVASVDIKENK